MVEHEQDAIDAAQRQAQCDDPAFDDYRGKIIALERNRFLVAVYMNRSDATLRPSPVALYAVSLDCKAARRAPNINEAPYGFHPERRK